MLQRSALAALLVLASFHAPAQAAPLQGVSSPQAVAPPFERPSASLSLPLLLAAYGEDPGPLDEMGSAMEVLGNYLFVGAPGDGGGRVDVWYRVPVGYILVQRLFLPATIAGSDDRFGRSLAADGGLLAVGTRTAIESGRVVLFRRGPSGLYALERLLSPANGHPTASFFGEHVSVLDGEIVAVSARGELAVHVFEADASGVFPTISTAILDAVNTGTVPSAAWMNGFGVHARLFRPDGGPVRILVGMEDACFYQRSQQQAPDEVTPDPSGATAARTGGVAVLRKIGPSWRLEQRLIPEYSKTKNFGFELDVDGKRVAVGALYSRLFSNGFDAGSASVFEWDGSRLVLLDTTWPSRPAQNAWFGYGIELRGDHLAVGQPYLWGGPQGLVEVFRLTGGHLEREALLEAHDGNGAANPSALGDSFGREIVCNVYGELLVAAPFSAPYAGTPPLYAGGELYLYR